MNSTKASTTISAIIAVAVLLIIVWILTQERAITPVVVESPIVPEEVTVTEVPADGEPATVTEVKPLAETVTSE